MQAADGETRGPTPQESWEAINDTLERTRSSLYVAGSATILVVSGAIASVGMLAEYAIATWGSELRNDYPWISAPLWLALVAAMMAANSVIGSRAGQKAVPGDGTHRAGIRVFFFWLTVAAAAFALPGVSGAWTGEDPSVNILRLVMGIVGLGYILFGIMVRPVIAVIGLGFVAAFFAPSYLLDDAALAVSAALVLAVSVAGMLWLRKSDTP